MIFSQKQPVIPQYQTQLFFSDQILGVSKFFKGVIHVMAPFVRFLINPFLNRDVSTDLK